MAASDIKAGRAYVELMLNDSKFLKGLRRAGDRLKSYGTGVAQVGAGVMASGAAITGSLLGAVKQFASMGDELDKMSARTGIGASALAELGFAAEQSGSDIGAVENSVRRMQKTIGDANRGLSTANDAFDSLGLNLADINDMSPEDQFQAIADRIADIEDPTKRANAAMQIFGSRQGTALLPMLESLKELRQEARDLGLAPSDESIKKAAQVTDAFNRIYRAVGAVVYEVGYALSDTILTAADVIKNIVVTTGKWVKENKGLVKTIFAIGVGLVGAGAAIVAIGGTIFAAGAALGGLAAALSAIGTTIGLLLNPITLVAAALAGGVYLWTQYTDSGQKAVNSLMGSLQSMLGFTKNVFGGIYEALAGGNLQLAGEIAMAGLKVVWLKGVSALTGIFGDFIGKFGSQIAGGDFAGAWQTVILQMSEMWAKFSEYVVKTFTKAAGAVVDAWQTSVKSIGNTLLEQSAQGGASGRVASWILGTDLQEQQRRADRLNQQQGLPGQSVLSDAKSAFNSSVDSQFQAPRDFLKAMNLEAERNTAQASRANAANIAGGASANNSALIAEATKLERLREQARQASEAAAEAEKNRKKNIDDSMSGVGRNMGNFTGTFSAAALAAVGGGGGPMERTAKGIEQLIRDNKKTQEINENMLREIRMGGVFT